MTRLLAIAVAGVLFVAAPAARAHVGHVVIRATRYLKIEAAADHVRVVVSLSLGEAEGRRIMVDADTDGDNELTQSEADAYVQRWAEGLRHELPLAVDGEDVELSWDEGHYFDPIGSVRAVPTAIEVVARWPLTGGEHALALRDEMVRPETFERTDVAFRVRDGAELLASGIGAAPAGLNRALFYPPPRSGRPGPQLGMRVSLPETSLMDGLSMRTVWVALAVLIAVVIFVAVRRRGKRS